MNPIRQIMPAPGWRAVTCAIKDGQPTFTSEPLCAFAIDEKGTVVPLVFDDDQAIDFAEENCKSRDTVGKLLGPGETLTDNLKKDLEAQVRRLKTIRP